jgi:DNA-binding CsgD family transcriptional regulator
MWKQPGRTIISRVAGDAVLLERDRELLLLDDAIRSAIAGQGRALVIEGPAGIGKTSLLVEARRRAELAGMAAAAGQGAFLETEFGFGVARQLFEPVIADADSQWRARLLEGAASLSAPVVAPGATPDGRIGEQTAIVHGLYWLMANLAEKRPLVIAVDDLQWSDGQSLQFLAYLSRRLDGLTVLLVVAVRTGDPQVDPSVIAELLSIPSVQVVRPRPLSIEAVRVLVERRLGPADERFLTACRTASGGVPFLLEELAGVLRADGVRPSRESANLVERSGPQTVARTTMLRLAHLGPAAAAVARATSVLGRQARLDRVAAVAELGDHATREAVDALIAMEVLAPGWPVRFVHPLVHQAIYADLQPTARAAAHRRVAHILTSEKATVDEIATHLLHSEPLGEDAVVEVLRTAAQQALARGTPHSAVAYLRRALAEGSTTTDRRILVHELGKAEAVAGDPNAALDLTEAAALTTDPVIRARILYELATWHALSGHWDDFATLVRDALTELGDRDPDLAAHIETARGAAEFYDPRHAHAFEQRLPQLLTVIEERPIAGRGLALQVAAMKTSRGMDRSHVFQLVARGLDEGRFLRDVGSESPLIAHAAGALITLDALDEASQVVEDMWDDAVRRGSVVGMAAASIYRAWLNSQRGMLRDAEADLCLGIELCVEHRLAFWLPTAFQCGVDVLLERPQADDAAQLAESTALPASLARTISGAFILAVRGRLRLDRGQHAEAVADLRAAGRIALGVRVANPLWILWRSPLALALPRDARSEAQALLAEELAWARRMQLARCEGIALRAAGCIEGGERGIELLAESFDVLEHTRAALERARTLVELGAALRRANQRVAAREHLEQGLEAAHRCAAERLATRAEHELRAAGARPRRRAVTGPDALTASEARVARMAAEGMSNRKIAQSLFVTAKTVENQLGAAYRKLGVRSRDELTAALELGSRPA